MKSHQGAALGMVHPIDAVPDIMQEPGNLRQLHFPLGIAEILQNFRRNFGGAGYMGKGMLGVSVSLESNVRLADLSSDRWIVFNLFKSNISHIAPLFFLFFS